MTGLKSFVVGTAAAAMLGLGGATVAQEPINVTIDRGRPT